MGELIEQRRKFSDQRFEELKASLKDAPEICGDKACVYATGSFGRREASEYSDIDLFIVSLGDGESKNEQGLLPKLDEILLKAELIIATRKLRFPEFSKDGRFLQHHGVVNLIGATGKPVDDAMNTFTARLLLLLESKPLMGDRVHQRVINDVIAKYWREFPSHVDCFIPAYLANDVLRYWRTLCLNYEANTSEETPDRRAKRKLGNYKLKHSRMLTCYSALLFLLCAYENTGSVTVSDAQTMVYLTPTQRIERIATESGNPDVEAAVLELIAYYERFLNVTSASEQELVGVFSDQKKAHELRDEQSHFGDLVFKALFLVGKENKLYRRLVV
jgi:predicted nucleotidyltransferase